MRTQSYYEQDGTKARNRGLWTGASVTWRHVTIAMNTTWWISKKVIKDLGRGTGQRLSVHQNTELGDRIGRSCCLDHESATATSTILITNAQPRDLMKYWGRRIGPVTSNSVKGISLYWGLTNKPQRSLGLIPYSTSTIREMSCKAVYPSNRISSNLLHVERTCNSKTANNQRHK